MKSLGLWAIRFLQISTSALMVVLLLVLSWQVVSRYLVKDPSTVTEELSRLLLMWLGVLGTAFGFLMRNHLAFDVLSHKGSERVKKFLAEFSAVCILIFGLMVTIAGSSLVYQAWLQGQVSPVLHVPIYFVYLVLPLAGLFMCLAPFTELEE
jgi:TRAP-type C4-dicarboxylate transport system permease small subunit